MPQGTTEEESEWSALLGELDDAGWRELSDRWLEAVRHAVAGRVAGLMAASELLRSGEGRERVASGLDEEANRLLDLTRLLDLVPAGTGGSPRPLDSEELLRGVLGIHSRIASPAAPLPAFSAEPGLPAVLWDPVLMARSLLVLLDGMRDTTEGLRLRLTKTAEGRVLLRLEGRRIPRGAAAESAQAIGGGGGFERRFEVVRALLTRIGGRGEATEEEGGVVVVQLELPTRAPGDGSGSFRVS